MRVRRLHKTPAHLEITAFINLIVVLVPFLLSTAVFSRLSVLDVNLPAPSSTVARLKTHDLQLEVVLRHDAIEVGDRIGGLLQRIPRAGGGAALQTLTALLVQLKQRYPQSRAASVLAEPDTPYDDLVQVMDAVRATATVRGATAAPAELFPEIAIGDAPLRKAGTP